MNDGLLILKLMAHHLFNNYSGKKSSVKTSI